MASNRRNAGHTVSLELAHRLRQPVPFSPPEVCHEAGCDTYGSNAGLHSSSLSDLGCSTVPDLLLDRLRRLPIQSATRAQDLSSHTLMILLIGRIVYHMVSELSVVLTHSGERDIQAGYSVLCRILCLH